jgi:hypothetical protein
VAVASIVPVEEISMLPDGLPAIAQSPEDLRAKVMSEDWFR